MISEQTSTERQGLGEGPEFDSTIVGKYHFVVKTAFVVNSMSSARISLPDAMAGMGLDPAIGQKAEQRHGPSYVEMVGFIPPRVQARAHVTGALDPTTLDLQERLRDHVLATPHLEPKMVQLILFGILLMDRNDAAQTHAIAARRAGASWDELQAVVNLCFLFRGLPGANRGAEILARVAAREHEAAQADAMQAKP